MDAGTHVRAKNATGMNTAKDGLWSLDDLREFKSRGVELGTPAMRHSSSTTPSACRWTSCRTCTDQGIVFDQAGFDHAMEEQRARARASWKGAAKQTANPAYQHFRNPIRRLSPDRSDNCEVLAIIKNGQGAQELKPGDEGEVILDHTPFYAESGGQVGDRGWLYSDDHNTVVAEVKGATTRFRA